MTFSGPHLDQNRFPHQRKETNRWVPQKKIPLRQAEAWGLPCCSVAQGAGEGGLGVPIEGRLIGHRGTRVVRARAPCRWHHVWMGWRGTMRRAVVAAIYLALALALAFCFLGWRLDLEQKGEVRWVTVNAVPIRTTNPPPPEGDFLRGRRPSGSST